MVNNTIDQNPTEEKETMKNVATLIAYNGTHKVTVTELAQVPTPAATETHKPIAHIEYVNTIKTVLERRKIEVIEEEYAVGQNGMRLFGTMVLRTNETQEYTGALGIRTANNKSMSLQMVAGMRVFVCDNMAFSGDVIALRRKHTVHVELMYEVTQGIERFLISEQQVAKSIENLKQRTISDVQARDFMFRAFATGVAPVKLLHDVDKAYFEPPHEQFKPRTAWSLHNAFTEAFKRLPAPSAQSSAIELGRMMKM